MHAATCTAVIAICARVDTLSRALVNGSVGVPQDGAGEIPEAEPNPRISLQGLLDVLGGRTAEASSSSERPRKREKIPRQHGQVPAKVPKKRRV